MFYYFCFILLPLKKNKLLILLLLVFLWIPSKIKVIILLLVFEPIKSVYMLINWFLYSMLDPTHSSRAEAGQYLMIGIGRPTPGLSWLALTHSCGSHRGVAP